MGTRPQMAAKDKKVAELRVRAVASALIVLLHLMMGLLLAEDRVIAIAAPSPVIDIDLSPGTDIGSSPAAVASTEESGMAETSRPDPMPDDTAMETSLPASAIDTETASERVPTDPSEVVGDVETPMPMPSLDEDVLKQVEDLIGTTVSDLSIDTAQFDQSISEGWIASQSGGGGGCQLNETLRLRLMADQTAVEELGSYPVAERSVSNAIQLWNGEWLGPLKADSTSDLLAVRRVIAATVSEAPGDCQRAPLQGPRFVFVTLPETAPIILVIGSGEWRWADLAAPEPRNFLRWFGTRPRED